jgi:cation transport ATPase
MLRTIFEISQMDCPSEENLIRIKLDEHITIKDLEFDIPNRKLTVLHEESIKHIEQSIIELNLGCKKITTEVVNEYAINDKTNQSKILWTVLVINFTFFLIEITTGLLSKSMGLVADSLDMLADSFVYGLSLFAVGGTIL